VTNFFLVTFLFCRRTQLALFSFPIVRAYISSSGRMPGAVHRVHRLPLDGQLRGLQPFRVLTSRLFVAAWRAFVRTPTERSREVGGRLDLQVREYALRSSRSLARRSPPRRFEETISVATSSERERKNVRFNVFPFVIFVLVNVLVRGCRFGQLLVGVARLCLEMR